MGIPIHILFYSLPEKLCSITSLSKQLAKKSENHEPSWRIKTWRASFFLQQLTYMVH